MFFPNVELMLVYGINGFTNEPESITVMGIFARAIRFAGHR